MRRNWIFFFLSIKHSSTSIRTYNLMPFNMWYTPSSRKFLQSSIYIFSLSFSHFCKSRELFSLSIVQEVFLTSLFLLWHMRKAHAETSFNSPRLEIELDSCAVEFSETFFLSIIWVLFTSKINFVWSRSRKRKKCFVWNEEELTTAVSDVSHHVIKKCCHCTMIKR